MKRSLMLGGTAAVLLAAGYGARSVMGGEELKTLEPGRPAPAFTLPSASGGTVELSSKKGSFVVLEWLNHGCPYVRKHYDSGNMQKLQKEFTGKGVAWYSIISSAPGKQGHCSPEEARSDVKENEAGPTAVLLDPEGRVGRDYGAKTTPHMFVVDPEGMVVYNGAIDDKKSTRAKDVEGAHNYLRAALGEAMAGKPVTKALTAPYGCSVKYGEASAKEKAPAKDKAPAAEKSKKG